MGRKGARFFATSGPMNKNHIYAVMSDEEANIHEVRWYGRHGRIYDGISSEESAEAIVVLRNDG